MIRKKTKATMIRKWKAKENMSAQKVKREKTGER